jgi:hypothetical protein
VGAPQTTGKYDVRPTGQHIGSHGRMVLGAVGLVLAMALVAYAAVRFDGLVTPGPQRAQNAANTTSTSASPTAPTGPTARQAMQRCQTVWAAQEPALRTAARSLAQWQVHVDAMNQLVAGKITVQQASAFWAKSRIGAAERVAAFERADRRLGQVRAGCTARGVQPATTGGGAPTRAQLQACARGARDRSGAIVAAEESVATWQDHINDMEMFRMGQMSASTATRMWSKNWHKGQRQLNSYKAKARKAARQSC